MNLQGEGIALAKNINISIDDLRDNIGEIREDGKEKSFTVKDEITAGRAVDMSLSLEPIAVIFIRKPTFWQRKVDDL